MAEITVLYQWAGSKAIISLPNGVISPSMLPAHFYNKLPNSSSFFV